MYELKPLARDDIAAALVKAERYRLLNEPAGAESICLDVLAVDADHQEALITLLLARTDQFSQHLTRKFRQARELLDRLDDEHDRHYYRGLICERRATAHFRQGGMSSGEMAYDWYRQAMEAYEKAIGVQPEGKPSAVLRWNTCARMIDEQGLAPRESAQDQDPLLEW